MKLLQDYLKKYDLELLTPLTIEEKNEVHFVYKVIERNDCICIYVSDSNYFVAIPADFN